MLTMGLSFNRLLSGMFFLIALLVSSQTYAADDIEGLAKASQNPVADMITLPFQDNMNFGIGPYDRTQNIINVQPVIPIHLNQNWNLITRTILPIIHQPAITQAGGATDGLGDLNPTLFLSPRDPGKLIWGAGPVFVFPTATDRVLGQEKWSLGPSLVLLTMPGKWVIGVLANNVWSVAGNQNRTYVNQFLMQYFINYNMPKGWYITSAPIITANWAAKSSDVWTVPFGGGFGRVFKLGHQPLNIGVQGYYNVWKPELGADWQLRLQITLLFPT